MTSTTPSLIFLILKYIEVTENRNMLANQSIKIAIIEDLKEVALEMQELFNEQEDLVCTQVYHSAEDAIIFLPKFPADVVIVDIGLPGASGVEAIVAIRELMLNTQFCMFTVFIDDEKIFKSLKAGAKGYILKNSSSEKILSSARELYKGGSPMNSEIDRKVIDAFSAPKDDPEKATNLPLTKREYELLELLS